jgi:hypothetical protein
MTSSRFFIGVFSSAVFLRRGPGSGYPGRTMLECISLREIVRLFGVSQRTVPVSIVRWDE